MVEEWSKGCPIFQHSIIPVFKLISILLGQGNRKEGIGNFYKGTKVILEKSI